jgi:hypothetical protein
VASSIEGLDIDDQLDRELAGDAMYEFLRLEIANVHPSLQCRASAIRMAAVKIEGSIERSFNSQEQPLAQG